MNRPLSPASNHVLAMIQIVDETLELHTGFLVLSRPHKAMKISHHALVLVVTAVATHGVTLSGEVVTRLVAVACLVHRDDSIY